jgi:hypothetical protein
MNRVAATSLSTHRLPRPRSGKSHMGKRETTMSKRRSERGTRAIGPSDGKTWQHDIALAYELISRT